MVVLAAILAILSGCSKDRKPENIVFLTLDTFRADHLGVLSGGRVATPALDGLAARGILFENAWTPIPITLPAHKSIFFGQAPYALATYNNGQIVSSRRTQPSFVQAFRKKGFATAAFISLGVLTQEFGTAEGFDKYEDRFPAGRWYLTAGEVNRRVIPWLEVNRDKPFFLWVHYSDPHDPYSPPDMPEDLTLRLNGRVLGSYRLNDYALKTVELDLRAGENTLVFEVQNPFQHNPTQFLARLDLIRFRPEAAMRDVFWSHAHRWYKVRNSDVRFFKDGAFLTLRAPAVRRVTMEFRGKLNLPKEGSRMLYRREIEYLDGRVGELLAALDRLGLRDNTAVVAVGDHGEGLGEYHLESGVSHFGHIHHLQSVYLRIPLIIAVPGDRRNGSRRTEPAALTDIAPTILELMGLRGASGFPGRDLLRLWGGASVPLFMETYRPEAEQDRFGLLDGRWHMILSPETGRRLMYDVSADPAESADVWGTAAVPADVARDFERRLGDFARRVLAGKKDTSIDPKAEEMLKSLGYIGK